MPNVWFVGDTHFGHTNIITFLDDKGQLLRPFNSIKEHDERLVSEWNAVVRPADRVYHLGDVAMAKRCIATVGRCVGRKVLLRGNHDIFKLHDYTPYFDDIRAYKVYPAHKLVVSHVPIHPQYLSGRFVANAHGHAHAASLPDPRYINCCVENTGWRPVALEEVISLIPRRNAIECRLCREKEIGDSKC